MELSEVIGTRRSVRKFLDLPVEWEKIGAIVESGRLAPSAGNTQMWKFIVVIEPEKRREIAAACLKQHWVAGAPVIVVVCAEPGKAKRFYGARGEFYTIQSCAAAVENMLLTAHSNSLGACWVGAFDDEMVRRALSIPGNASAQAIIPIGYPDEKPPEPIKHAIEDLTFFEKWGNRVRFPEELTGEYNKMVGNALAKGKEIVKRIAEKIKSIKKK